MVFNSFIFIEFFFLVFTLYWFFANKKVWLQNGLLLIASCIFYTWADWRFLILLLFVALVNYLLGIWIEDTANTRKRRILLTIGLIQGIGVLVYFKYFNFFIESFNSLFNSLHLTIHLQLLNIIVPIGISFYTFRTISYLLDIDKGKISACRNWDVFFNYVLFFPAILSGPIDKAKQFIPQLEELRVFDINQVTRGLRQILWGLFKKIVIADNLASVINPVYNNYEIVPASSLVIASFLYSFQIYADFSGYTDMSIGVARLLGFNVTRNFDYPFFSQNVAEFWRKWHISLTLWLTEYVYTPLSIYFRNWDKKGMIIAIIVNFTICGIWHGANWTYILFGFLHGCYFIPLIINGSMNKRKKMSNKGYFPSLKEVINIISTFILITFTFIIFKSATIFDAFKYMKLMFSKSLFSQPHFPGIDIVKTVVPIVVLTLIFQIVEWMNKDKSFPLDLIEERFSRPKRWFIYYFIIVLIIYFAGAEQEFIYVQF
jgi:alginate O-acetyltransferase complex protein AlgI